MEDDEEDYILTRDLLSEIEGTKYELEWASTYDTALDAILDNGRDIYLLDFRLGEHTGLDLIREAIERGCQAPMILLTGQGDHDVDIEAMKAGAADYLVKGRIDPSLLERSIRYAIERKRDEEQLMLREEQLRQSQKMEVVGMLVSGIAHDFNNVMTIVLGASELLKQKLGPNNPLRNNAEMIGEAAERGSRLTRQLLMFSRKQPFQPKVLSLNTLLTGIEKLLRRLIREDIRMELNLSPKLKRVKADPGQIEQVIMNLVANARDAMPQGGNITIETTNVELDEELISNNEALKSGTYVLLTVSDTGCGMDEETQANIFEPFFTTKEPGKGTGLGLATAYGVVDQVGGHIDVTSMIGKGSTLRIYFPTVEEEAGAAETRPSIGLALCGHETILLVDDDDDVRRLVKDTLQSMGYTVLHACNGYEALQISKQHGGSIDLLLTDMIMPGMSGSALASNLRAQRPSLSVLYMSGYTDDDIMRHGELDPTVTLLNKPFKPTALCQKVREVLGEPQEVPAL